MIKRAAALTLAVLALAGCASSPTAEPTASSTPTAAVSKSFVATGSVSAPVDATYFPPGADSHTIGDECITTSGYDDISEGSQVIISDDSGKTVGVDSLDAGVLTAPTGAEDIFDATCVFRFRVGVDSSSDFFGVQAGNDNRGVLQYKRVDLLNGVDLTLGD